MDWRRALTVLAGAVSCALATGTMMAGQANAATGAAATPAVAAMAANTAVRPAGTPTPAGHLGDARPVPGLRALNVGGGADVSAVRCPSPGFCTAAGFYLDGNGHHQAFIVNETDFTWGKAFPVPGLAALGNGGPTDITALSCPTAGNCMAGGWFVSINGNLQPFVTESANGTFGAALPVFSVDDHLNQFIARVTSLSCATPGNCTVALILPIVPAGGGAPLPKPFLATKTNGQWGPLRAVPGVPGPGVNLPAGISSVSCWKPGDCMAVGGYTAAGGNDQPFIAIQEGGEWSGILTIPGIDGPSVTDFNPAADAQGTQVSCWAFTSCTVAGIYGDHHGDQEVFVADWVNGVWAAQTIPSSDELNKGGDASVNGLGCGATGNCAVAGQFLTAPANDPSAQTHAFVDSRAAGDWSNAQEILGISNLPDSSAIAAACPFSGSCVAGGHYTDASGHQQAYVSFENTTAGTKDFGSFEGAQQVAGNLNAGGSAGVDDVSCSFDGECAVGGFYADAAGNQQGFVIDQSTATATAVSASASNVTAGNEQQVRITAKVTPFAGGTPTGTVTVLVSGTLDKTVCTITLSGGKGTCSLPAGSLPPGTYSFTGEYGGDQVYSGSTSASGGGGGVTVHVLRVKSATSVTLALSRGTVTFGREQAAHLTVKVTGQPGDIPSGKVTIRAGSIIVGVITLSHGKGVKTLTARQLRPGTYHLTAHYSGDLGNKASTSRSKTFTVRR
jgi:hypothetical protein